MNLGLRVFRPSVPKEDVAAIRVHRVSICAAVYFFSSKAEAPFKK